MHIKQRTNGNGYHTNGHATAALTVPQQYSLEAERATLGSILIDPPSLHQIAGVVKPEDFHLETHRWAFSEMQSLAAQDKPVDMLLLEQRLTLYSTGPAEGWTGWLIGLLNEVPTSVNVVEYARLVADYATRRRLRRAAEEIANLSYTDGDIEEQIGRAESLIFDINQGRNVDAVQPARVTVGNAISNILERREQGGKQVGLPTGFADLDRVLRGLKRGQIYTLAARPGMGKSALAVQIAVDLALRYQKRVLFFTPEMTEGQVINRALATQTGIPLTNIVEGRLTDQEMTLVLETAGRLSETHLHIDATPGITPGQVRSRAMRMYNEQGLDLIIVDHLHEMEPDSSMNARHLELGKIIRSLKATGKTVNCPVLVLSQLSRSLENRADKRPQLSDLREAGAIEEVSYAVMFLYRDDYYNDATTDRPGMCDVDVAKHRDGATGTLTLEWNGRLTRFRTPAREGIEF